MHIDNWDQEIGRMVVVKVAKVPVRDLPGSE
jgi:hypothetical protein